MRPQLNLSLANCAPWSLLKISGCPNGAPKRSMKTLSRHRPRPSMLMAMSRSSSSLKYEEVYSRDYRLVQEARAGISCQFYNHERPHQSERRGISTRVGGRGRDRINSEEEIC